MFSFPFRYSKTLTIGFIILVLCLIPSSEISKLGVQVSWADFVVHFSMFFAFSAALQLDLSNKIKQSRGVLMLITFIMSVALGLITEMLQYLITPLNRSGSISDLMFDILGSLSGIVLVALIKRKSASVS